MNVLFFLLINLFACFYQGITGFGGALIASPLSLLVLDKFTVVIALTIVGIGLDAFLYWKIKQPLNYQLLIPLCLASIVGMPFGIWFLKAISIDLLKIIVGSLAIIVTLIIAFTKFSLPRTTWLTVLAGFLSGTLQTSISATGPPVVILLMELEEKKMK